MREKVMRTLYSLAAILLVTSGALIPQRMAYAYNQDVSSGVVPVVLYVNDGAQVVVDMNSKKVVKTLEKFSGEWSGGSGFFVGEEGVNPQYIVTNYHVVADYIGYGEGAKYYTPIDYYNYDEYGDRYVVYLAFYDYELRVYYSENEYDVAYPDSYGDLEKVDLAVLRLRDATDKRHSLPIMIPSDDMIGETVYTVGFPGNADNDLTSASKYGTEDVTVHKGSINRFVANSGVGVERIAIDATIQHGNSGGPLVTEDGYVIGVNTNVISNSPYEEQIEADYYAISASEVVRFLDKNSVKYQLASASTENSDVAGTDEQATESASGPAEEDASEEPIVETPEKTDDSGSPAPSNDTGNGGSGIVIGIVIAIAVIVATAAIIAKNKKKKEDSSSQKSAVQPTVAASQTPVSATVGRAMLRSLSTQHNGMTVAVHDNTPVMIGRDPANCKVVFREGTEGVSGRHCSVSYDAASNEFILTDLRSTYGTFLMNGQKLTANVPYHLKSGDGFYVGASENAFRVEVG